MGTDRPESRIPIVATCCTCSTLLREERQRRHSQCVIFTGIGPAAESNHVTLRIKYGKIPKKTGISPDPAAESKVGYIPPFWHATVARPCVFVRAESMPKAAKAGLARSHGDELVQRTLDGSAQRPSPKAHRARPSATVPAQANRRKKRKATGSAGEPPAAAARSAHRCCPRPGLLRA